MLPIMVNKDEYILQVKTGFFFSRHSPMSMKRGRDLLLHGMHFGVQFDSDRCMGGSKPNENDFVFYPRDA